jgi:hypothetical protein
MAHDDSDEEARVLATRLFNSLATIIGRELCELYVVPQIASFADDPHSKVRKAVAGNFLNMCSSVSENSFKTKLLPVYQKLSKDSLWMVRKAAAEILPKITTLCDSQTISSILLELFRNFTNDNQKYVRIAAIEVLGQFINLLKKEDLSESILEFYIKIVEEYYNNKDVNESDVSVLFTFRLYIIACLTSQQFYLYMEMANGQPLSQFIKKWLLIKNTVFVSQSQALLVKSRI